MNIPENDFKEIEKLHGIFVQKGVRIILRGHVELDPYFDSIPVSWRACLEQTGYSATIARAVWAEVDKQVPSAVSSFFTHVVEVGLTVAPNRKTVHGLTYFLKHQSDRGTFHSGWLGGLPASDSDVAVFEKDTNTLFPQSYRVFCGVHNGLLWNGNGGMGYLPIHKLIAWRNTLGFYGDGAGNLQVFDLTKPLDSNDYLTADWDHETDEFTNWMSFWEFVPKRFAVEFG